MRFQDLFHSPHRGAFHRSLAVLSAIGRRRYFALEGGPPCFQRPSTAAAVLAVVAPGLLRSRLRDSHPLRCRLPVGFRLAQHPPRVPPVGSTRNPAQPRPDVGHSPPASVRFGLVPVRSPLLGESFSLLGVLRCFSSPSSPPLGMYSPPGAIPSRMTGYPIRKPTDPCVLSRSPWPFVARHVLLRPATPRHPPHTLSRLRMTSPRDITCTDPLTHALSRARAGSHAPLVPSSVVNVRGGSFWTRTRDLCLIRAAL